MLEVCAYDDLTMMYFHHEQCGVRSLCAMAKVYAITEFSLNCTAHLNIFE